MKNYPKLKAKTLEKFPMLVVDGIVIKNGRVLLIERKKPPYLRHSVLPGGFVEKGETAEKAVVREVWEETGLRTKVIELTGVYSNPKRDPRGHIVSIAFLLKPTGGKIKETDEAKNTKYFIISRLPKRMGFDHRQIVMDALRIYRKRKK